MGNRKQKIIVIIGPTASGKSSLGIKLARKFNGEIVSADSRQVYRGMNIGTAKPTQEERILIPHHLVDIKNPDENYTVAEYKHDATKAIRKIIKKGKLPILVGGTGLYVKVIVDNLKIPEVGPDFKLRHKLEKEIKKYGLNFVFKKLIKLDPEAAYIVDPNNPRRIIRALEIAITTKKPFSAQRKSGKPPFDFIGIGIRQTKNVLDERISNRVDLMIKNGLIEEVKNLVKEYDANNQSFDAIGYREIIDYFDKKITLTEAMDSIKKNTINYAKRQMTWFKKDKKIHWIKNQNEAEKLVKKFLK
ncbi:MAG: tRNA (adenosine(37)-N6)-dimethylallyltransferase MiaA [Candidatus Azambacteria bacterium]|nr:tRNA (adenosine(37)-N6)-dimethylallyltransferase MiaA [Candidatus Azambacteria bacterium]